MRIIEAIKISSPMSKNRPLWLVIAKKNAHDWLKMASLETLSISRVRDVIGKLRQVSTLCDQVLKKQEGTNNDKDL